MNEILEIINNNIEEVLNNSELLQRVCDYLNSSFVLNSDSLKANPNILRISSFIIPKIKEDPSIVLSFPYKDMTSTDKQIYLREAAIQHFIPSFEQIEDNPELGRNLPIGILERLLRSNPRMLIYFPEEEILPHSKGIEFVATEEELKRIPALRKIDSIMEASIIENPSLIKYLETKIDEYIVEDALKETKLTREDFLNNQFLCTIEYLCIGEYTPYYRYLSNEKKAIIVSNYLEEGKIDDLLELPFLQHEFNPYLDESINVGEVIELIKAIKPDLDRADEPSVNNQNWEILNSVLDGIAAYRYRTNKNTFKFKSIDALADRFEQYFYEIDDGNKDDILEILANECIDFMESDDREEVSNSLKKYFYRFYDIYLKNNRSLPVSGEDGKIIAEFCNQILNDHRDKYIVQEKEKLKNIINDTFGLKPDIIDQILREKKRNKALAVLREEIYSGKLDGKIDEIFYKEEIRKQLKKSNIFLPDDKFDEIFNHLVKMFIETGKLDKKELHDYFEESGYGLPSACIIQIVKKLNKELNARAEKTVLSKSEAIITSGDRFRYTKTFVAKNFSMTNRKRTDYVLSSLLIELLDNPKKCKKAVNNIDDLFSLKRIIPFFGSIKGTKELSVQMLIDILSYFPRIKDRLDISDERIELSFEKLVGFATEYGKSSSILRTIISPTITDVIGEFNVGKYAEFYLENMFDRRESSIPIVSGETRKYTFSSDFRDQDRLIIGRMYRDSCIDLNDSSGYDTYLECLKGPDGDAILIRERISNELAGRVLAVRRGNVVQLQLRNLDRRISEEEYKNIIRLIGKQMIRESAQCGDNLDVVVVATDLHKGLRDDRLKTNFPHADWGGFYEVVAEKEDDVQFSFNEPVQFIYTPKRKRVREDATDQEISMMKAISIRLNPDQKEREELERSFEPVIFEETENSILLGEDWYIIHRDGEIIEQVVIPTKDNRQVEEIKTAIETFGLGKGSGAYHG